MKGVLSFSLYSLLAVPPVVRGFVQQSFTGLRRTYGNRDDAATTAVTAHLPIAADSDGSAIKDGEKLILPFHHSSTVYIEMTDM